MSENNQQNSVTSAVPLECLVSCPDCGANPEKLCVINSTKAHEPNEKNRASMVCNRCGFAITVSTSGALTAIRKMWNACGN